MVPYNTSFIYATLKGMKRWVSFYSFTFVILQGMPIISDVQVMFPICPLLRATLHVDIHHVFSLLSLLPIDRKINPAPHMLQSPNPDAF